MREPERRRPDAWFDAWWQDAAQERRSPLAAQRFLSERGEVSGWAAMRPGNHRTHDTLVSIRLAGEEA